MAKHDMEMDWRDFQFRDLRLAFALLTRLPFPHTEFDPKETRPAAHGAWAYPLVGLAVALLMAFAALVVDALGAAPAVTAGAALLIGILSTGAMHEDGLADCADGFWGGWTQERRLEIMKDSQIGTYGVLALVLMIGLKWALLIQLIEGEVLTLTLIAAAVTSRAAMVGVMHLLPRARDTGLAHQTGRPPRTAALAAGAIGLLVTALVVGHMVFVIAALAGLTMMGVMGLARSKIGGQTGDVLGATQQIVELVVLFAAATVLA